MNSYPPQTSEKDLTETINVAIDWAFAHGLVVRPSQGGFANNAAVTHAPFALYPTPFPRKEFEQAKKLQQPWNSLIHKMSNDSDLISETMET